MQTITTVIIKSPKFRYNLLGKINNKNRTKGIRHFSHCIIIYLKRRKNKWSLGKYDIQLTQGSLKMFFATKII